MFKSPKPTFASSSFPLRRRHLLHTLIDPLPVCKYLRRLFENKLDRVFFLRVCFLRCNLCFSCARLRMTQSF
ncbi:hypothetical protein HanRHA438_Chr17g0831621 [Helianthus annuus]|nr:hypothetical protein HanRHA438_Chr17g0831621 [Helianthus annuus]